MLRFTAPVWIWSGEGGTWHFITVPAEAAEEIRAEGFVRRGGFGSVRVEATINEVTWRTSVFPQKSGGYILPVKAEARRKANIAAGDDVELNLDVL